MAEQSVVQIQSLCKHYGSKKAVDDISFSIKRGEIVGFLGPNGAGKTTTMNILTGYISSTSGRALVDGIDILENPDQVKKKIGYLPENPPLYLDMTVLEYLSFVYDLKKVQNQKKGAHLKQIMQMVDLTEVKGRLIKNLSKGYKQRVGLAQALIGDPEVLILDEPTVGLDPKQIIEIRNMIKQLGKDRTVILSTHILPEVSAVCDRVIIINEGKIVASGTTDKLSETISGKGKYLLRIAADELQGKNVLSAVSGIKSIDCIGSKEAGTTDFIVQAFDDCDIRPGLFAALAKANYAIYMLKPMELTLEEVFVKLVNKEIDPTEEDMSGEESVDTDVPQAESDEEEDEQE